MITSQCDNLMTDMIEWVKSSPQRCTPDDFSEYLNERIDYHIEDPYEAVEYLEACDSPQRYFRAGDATETYFKAPTGGCQSLSEIIMWARWLLCDEFNQKVPSYTDFIDRFLHPDEGVEDEDDKDVCAGTQCSNMLDTDDPLLVTYGVAGGSTVAWCSPACVPPDVDVVRCLVCQVALSDLSVHIGVLFCGGEMCATLRPGASQSPTF